MNYDAGKDGGLAKSFGIQYTKRVARMTATDAPTCLVRPLHLINKDAPFHGAGQPYEENWQTGREQRISVGLIDVAITTGSICHDQSQFRIFP